MIEVLASWRRTNGEQSLHRSGLLRRALNVSGGRSKKAVVERALQEFVARREPKGLLDRFGKFEWDCTDDNLEGSRD